MREPAIISATVEGSGTTVALAGVHGKISLQLSATLPEAIATNSIPDSENCAGLNARCVEKLKETKRLALQREMKKSAQPQVGDSGRHSQRTAPGPGLIT